MKGFFSPNNFSILVLFFKLHEKHFIAQTKLV